MKTLISLFLLLFLNACSHQNAFSQFKMDEEQERSITSLKRSKITQGTNTVGAFNALYLNSVYPNLYNGNEYFYVYMYLKKEQTLTLSNEDNNTLHLTLNGNSPLEFKKLNPKNRFSNLSSSKNKWNQYYLVSFDTVGKILTLKLESDQFDSASLKYQKDRQ